MTVERTLYARAGEDIVCEAGHVVTRPTQNLYAFELITGRLLEGMSDLRDCDPAKGVLGDVAPPCACGERWCWFGALRFREGYRVIEDSKVVHRPLDEMVVSVIGSVPSPGAQP